MLKFENAGAPTPVQRMTAAMARWIKRGQKTDLYYRGVHADPANLSGHDAARAQAAVDKRLRKNAKRLSDALQTEVGQRIAREAITIRDRFFFGNPKLEGKLFGLLDRPF